MICSILANADAWNVIQLNNRWPSTAIRPSIRANQPVPSAGPRCLQSSPLHIDFKAIIRKCSPLLKVQDDLVSFAHGSARYHMQLYLNDVYASGYAHSRICERSLGILKKSSVEEIHKALDRTTIPSPQSNASALELLRYACLFWASHLHGSKDIEEHMTLVEAAPPRPTLEWNA
ncbi:hypothetical protein BDV29DRAFT_16555 [Aspergillus leporis]|uniref:Uncharacterized protein n=1 Tax=Aspergillus leporis TaxID=41062 RepID=A0A5N5WTA9_9EURO|nr:hypothetical protein BDV29DRAFT_16555 [Aspergillus leporis]